MNTRSPRREAFVREYVKDLHATKAAIRAGYSEKTARHQGSKLLADRNILAAIAAEQASVADTSRIDAAWVLHRAQQLVDRCMQIEPVYDSDGAPTGEYKFDSAGAARGLQLIAKHTGGFSDRVEHSGPDGGPVAIRAEVVFVDPKK